MNVTRIRAPQLKPNIVLKLASLILACLLNMTANAAIDVYDFDSPARSSVSWINRRVSAAQNAKIKTLQPLMHRLHRI